MPFVTGARGEVSLHYEISGEGPAVLLIAPGGMRSAAALWARMAIDPRTALADGFRVVAMDQRNAGQSHAPIRPSDDWSDYTRDQIALMDHLAIDRFHVVGMCIGGPYALALARTAPERVCSAVLIQPIGEADNRTLFREMFDAWRDTIAADHPEADAAAWDGFRSNMFDGDFLFCIDEDDVRACRTPLLLLRGDDPYHPAAISDRIAELAPEVEFVRDWKEGDDRTAAVARLRRFLQTHSD